MTLMVQKTNGFERFWKELKRRRVINVITVYASASFGIIEIVNNLTTPLHLPTSVSTIVIIVLAVGFPFAIILSWLYDLTGGTFVRTKPVEDLQAEEKPKVPNAWKVATYISFAVIIGLVVLNIARGSSILKPGSIQSLVILPFDNYTGDEKLDYFVSGMHSSLIADVGKIGSLRVISETTSDVYKNAHKSLPQIASELDVDAVVEAQVMCLGDSICLQVRMVTADRKEKQLWSEGYSEDKRKILGLYNQVTKQIAHEVMVKLSPDEERVLSRSMIVNKEAYDAYLKGWSYWKKLTQSDLDTALKCFELAKEKDPGFALAYSGISEYWMARQQLGMTPPVEAGPKIIESAMKALELDSSRAEVHYALAVFRVYTMWDWEKGEYEFKKAIKIDPNHALALADYAILLSVLGRNEEASKHIEVALNLDPLNAHIRNLDGWVLLSVHKYNDAIKAFQDALKIQKDDPVALGNLEVAFEMVGKYKEAVEQYKLAIANDTELVNALQKGYNEGGFKGALLTYNKVAESRYINSYWNPSDIANNYAFVGLKDKAIYWLEQAYKVHDPGCAFLLSPYYDNLRDDPRFQELCKRMKLPYK